ncbi:MAG: DUF4301 family protein [Bacteroidales bacterium]|nr:DUF4301 family protein [Bacteroidales bacterium]
MENLKNLLSKADFSQIMLKGISFDSLNSQYNQFVNGLLPANIVDIASPDNSGIKVLNDKLVDFYKKHYSKYKNELKVLKFVPASGAATRMFKDLFEFIDSSELSNSQIDKLFYNIEKFAFFNDLQELMNSFNSSVEQEIGKKNYKHIIEYILLDKGLNYGSLPKGLIKFHDYKNTQRTAFEEHLAESILYASTNEGNFIHFTVSPEHKQKFEELAQILIPKYKIKTNTDINIEFSVQDPATDTLAVTPNNLPFRNEDGSILFRPGGHGALIYNLNNIDADIIFVKNIDNVVPDAKKIIDTNYKKALAGILIETQQNIFRYIHQLHHNPSVETIQQIFNYVHNNLNVKSFFNFSKISKTEKMEFLLQKLDRPLRVCGMVKNEGEPGGGPFFVMQNDNTASLQIVEKAQIDLSKSKNKQIFENSSHFNPVDLVISHKRYNNEKFNLLDFIDPQAGFISQKSKNGKNLKALELPGLWNGAMADWNTVFVEVPVETFNPVKTIFDLLRNVHQNN